jgi:putative transposase
MKAKRRRHDTAFKARVGLEALKGQKTTQQIAAEYDVHPTQVSEWKKTLSEGLGEAFERGKGGLGEEFEREREKLHSKIGELTVKLDFLEKNPDSSAYEPRRAGGKNHPGLSVREQCELLGVSRSTLNYRPVEEDPEDTRIMRILDEIYMTDPCIGSRRLGTLLEREHGIKANRKRIQRLRRKMGIETIWCRPRRTSIPDNGHRKYPIAYFKLPLV